MAVTIKLFPKNATDFSTNGIKILQPVSCTVSEEVNGEYSLTMAMPKGDTSSIQAESIIKAPTPKGDQLFRVYLPDVDALGSNTYCARHIFYDMLDSFIEDKRPNGSGTVAVTSILDSTVFTGTSDITATNTAEYQMISPVKALLGTDNSFVNRWGGEIERDNFMVRMLQRIGADRGVTIRYRKNLTGLTLKTDLSSVVTRIYPTGRRGDGQTLLKLPEKYIDSSLIANYAHPKIAHLDYSDIKLVTEISDSDPELVTEAQAHNKLRAAAVADFAKGLDKPTVSANVEFIPLETTEEYKDFAVLEKVYLGDTVRIYHEQLGLELSLRVVQYEYNSLTQRYVSITLGTVLPSVGTTDSVVGKQASDAQQTADKAKSKAASVEQEFKAADGQLLSKITDTANGLQSQITQTNTEIATKVSNSTFNSEISQLANSISHKVSAGEVSSIITQSSQEVTAAFNNAAGDAQVTKLDGKKFSFYSGATHIGDIGVNGNSLVFNLDQGYAMAWQCQGGGNLSWYPTSKDGVPAGFHVGGELYVDSGHNVHASNITSSSGMTTQIGITMSDGSTRTLQFTNGLLTDNNV